MDQHGLRVLLFQRLPGFWVARGLEHDLAVEGRSMESVIDRIHRLVFAHADFDRRHGRAPLSPFPAAPRRFWRAFERARRLPPRECRPGVRPCFGPITVAVISEHPMESIARPVFEQTRHTSDRSLGRGRLVH